MSISFMPPRWRLDDLVPERSLQGLGELESDLQARVAAFEQTRPALAATIPQADFLAILRQYEAITRVVVRLKAYSYLWLAEDTQNPAALQARGRVQRLLTEVANRVLFFSLWFKDLADADAAPLIAGSGDLHYYLESLRRFKPFTLSEAQEKVINLKDVNGIDALVKLYEMMTSHFSFELEVDGERKRLTRDQVSSYFHHPAPEMREAAYREYYRVYTDNSTILAQIYTHRVRDWHAEAIQLRGYAEPISYRNLANDLPDQMVDTLLDVCRRNAPLFQRYFRIKARALHMDKLRRYDIYAPFAATSKTYAFGEALALVTDSLRAFSPLLAEQAAGIVESQHLDAEARPGKRGGAFCYSALPDLPPWVLTNYNGQARDVATLAHELGHAVHSRMAGGHSVLTFTPPLPLAETASVFSEMLLTDRLLKGEDDAGVRRDVLVQTIDNAYITVTRQASFTLFEREAHRIINAGGSFDDLTAAYMDNLREQFGDAIDVADAFKWEWICIPHIYNSPFYTYAYSFGQLLVLALYRLYRAQGAAFVPTYLKLLTAGGSEPPARILAEAGLAVDEPTFWQGGFDMIRDFINELETLI